MYISYVFNRAQCIGIHLGSLKLSQCLWQILFFWQMNFSRLRCETFVMFATNTLISLRFVTDVLLFLLFGLSVCLLDTCLWDITDLFILFASSYGTCNCFLKILCSNTNLNFQQKICFYCERKTFFFTILLNNRTKKPNLSKYK